MSALADGFRERSCMPALLIEGFVITGSSSVVGGRDDGTACATEVSQGALLLPSHSVSCVIGPCWVHVFAVAVCATSRSGWAEPSTSPSCGFSSEGVPATTPVPPPPVAWGSSKGSAALSILTAICAISIAMLKNDDGNGLAAAREAVVLR